MRQRRPTTFRGAPLSSSGFSLSLELPRGLGFLRPEYPKSGVNLPSAWSRGGDADLLHVILPNRTRGFPPSTASLRNPLFHLQKASCLQEVCRLFGSRKVFTLRYAWTDHRVLVSSRVPESRHHE